jgi:glutathione S-transferase
MHAGFSALRQAWPMNCRRRYESFDLSREVENDVARIQSIWTECRDRYADGGDFLFGHFSNADAMFAPIASRFLTYGVTLDATCRAYVDTLVAHPPMHEWCEAAALEPVIEKYEFD